MVGVRSHYLRMSGYTYEKYDSLNYDYDSSVLGILKPFKVGGLWEIPISIMDSCLVNDFQNNFDLNQWKKAAMEKLELAQKNNLPYFVINVHDLYLSDNYPTIKQWYFDFIGYLIQSNFQFTTLQEACSELNKISGDHN